MFADDGQVAGPVDDMARVSGHLQEHMPATGLRFGKMQAIPACPDNTAVDPTVLAAYGCDWVASGCIEVMRAPHRRR